MIKKQNFFFRKMFIVTDLVTLSLAVSFVCFLALRLKLTAMVMAGRSVHLTTLFPGQA